MPTLDELDDDFLNGQLGLPQGAIATPAAPVAPDPAVLATIQKAGPPEPPPSQADDEEDNTPANTPTPQTAADSSPSVADVIAKKYGYTGELSDDALKAAQQNAAQKQAIANVGDALDSIARGISRSNQPGDDKFYSNLAGQANQPVQNILQRRQAAQQAQTFATQQEDLDPNSVKATIMRKQLAPLAKQVGLDPAALNDLGVTDLKNFSTGPLEFAAKLKNQQQIAADNRRMHEEMLEYARGTKANLNQQHALQSTQQLLESARGNPAAAQAERDLYSAQKADTLANLYGDPNKLSMPQVRLLAQEVGKIAAGGVSSQHELEGITPNSLMGRLSGVVSNLTNSPTPANAAAFVKQYQDYTKALKNDAQKVIQDKYGRIIESRKHQLSPDDYTSLKTQYLDRFKNDEPSTSAAAGKVKVSNGKQSFLIDPSDLADAQKDGFTQVQ